MDDLIKGHQLKVLTATNNLERVIENIINGDYADIDVNMLVRDYNIIRQELNKMLVNR